MLHAGGDTVFLDTLDVRDNHLTCKIWILTHVLEVTSVERSTADIDARTEKDILLAVACLLTYAAAVKERHLLVPCSCKVYKGRECSTGVICPACLIPLIPKDFRTDAVRTVCVPYFRNAETRNTT